MKEDLYLEELDAKIAVAKTRLEELDRSRREFVEEMQHKEVDRLDELMEETQLRLHDLEQPIAEAWKELHHALTNACRKLKLCSPSADKKEED